MNPGPAPTQNGPTPDLSPALVGHAADLADPDPRVRDERAYPGLADLAAAGLTDAERRWLGDLLAARLSDPRIEARSFAALGLAELAATGPFPPAWVQALRHWYASESDLRGWDPQLGWLHAVAHGADALAAVGRAGHAAPGPLLATLAARLVTPTEFVWSEQEDDRVAAAAASLLSAAELTEAEAVGWLLPVAALIAERPPGPAAPERANAIHTLRSLLVALGDGTELVSGPIRHAAAVREALRRALEPATSWWWRLPDPATDGRALSDGAATSGAGR